MKKLLACVLALVLIGCAALAEIDLSGMTYEELVALKDQINLAMWECEEWQEVTVPEGVWIVGEDIPAGHWTIRAAGQQDYFFIWYCDAVNPVTQSPAAGSTYVDYDLASPGFSAFGEVNATERDIDMQDGWCFINKGAVIVTPYAGKPDLGFK